MPKATGVGTLPVVPSTFWLLPRVAALLIQQLLCVAAATACMPLTPRAVRNAIDVARFWLDTI